MATRSQRKEGGNSLTSGPVLIPKDYEVSGRLTSHIAQFKKQFHFSMCNTAGYQKPMQF